MSLPRRESRSRLRGRGGCWLLDMGGVGAWWEPTLPTKADGTVGGEEHSQLKDSVTPQGDTLSQDAHRSDTGGRSSLERGGEPGCPEGRHATLADV